MRLVDCCTWLQLQHKALLPFPHQYRPPHLPSLSLKKAMASQPAAAAAAKAINPAFNPRTVHFWAPILKWGIVIAGIGDFYRPVESLSVTQNAALLATGSIWTRWCLIIKPKNYPLAAVNFFLAGVGSVQMGRIGIHHWKLKQEAGTTPASTPSPAA